jgi:ABC-type transport system substrate-binding protein
MAKARSATDDTKRKDLYAQLARKMNDYRNYVILFHDSLLMGVRKDVTGLQYFSDGVIRLKTAAFTSSG